jgi:hypothetical protein
MKRVGVVIFPGFQILDMVAVSVFEVANRTLPEPGYDVHILSEQGGQVSSSAHVRVDSEAFDDKIYDTLLVTGAMDVSPSSSGLLEFLRASVPASARALSYWAKRACSTDAGQPLTGTARAICNAAFRARGSRKTGSSWWTAKSGHRPV